MAEKRGRPNKDDGRRNFCNVRFNDSEKEMIRYLEIELDTKASDAIRRAVRFYYNFIKNC